MRTELLNALDRMTPEQRAGALLVLDIVSQPLTPRQLDAAFGARGLSRTFSRAVSGAIKGLHIVAVVDRDRG